jgi:hypothetical protein
MDKRMRGSALGLVILAALMVVGLPGLAVAGPKIQTTRPLSDAGYVIDAPGITTTRPVSDATFLAGSGARIETTRPLSDARFVIEASAPSIGSSPAGASSASPAWVQLSLMVGLLMVAAAVGVGLRRRPHRPAI